MNIKAFPSMARFIEGAAKTIKAKSHHGTMQANERRAPARQPEISVAMRQTSRQVNPTQNGQVRTQNRALAPSGLRKYPYGRSEPGKNEINACLCHNPIKRIATMAAVKGRSVLAPWNNIRLSQAADANNTTHHPTRTNGHASQPKRSQIIIAAAVAQTPISMGARVTSATCIGAGSLATDLI
jgi:hypothetical protein